MIRAARLVAACLALGLTGCIGADDDAGDARRGGSIAMGATAVPQELDPALATDPRATQLLWLAYTPLLTYRREEGREGTEVIPGLARGPARVSDDGLIYVLRLRRGLRYSNGTPVRPGDFERAVDRLRALRSPLAPLYAGIAAIDADARSGRIEIRLSAPDPAFESILALPSSAPVPRGTPAEARGRRPLPGLGPFRLARADPGRRVVLRRRPDFELPGVLAANVDVITVTAAGSALRQVRAVLTGSLDLTQEPIPPERLPEIRSQYADRYREDPAATTVALLPDANAPPLDDPAIRRALGQALDGEKLVRLYQGLLDPGCNVLPDTVLGHRSVDPCPFGPPEEPADLVAAQEAIEATALGAPVRLRADPGVPYVVRAYVLRTLRKVGLRARLGRGAGARVRLARLAPPVVHPAWYTEPLAATVIDVQLDEAIAAAQVAPEDEAGDAWARADERIVTEGYAAPLGHERLPSLFSERLDTDNCVRAHPVFGIDLSSLCLR